MGTDENVVGRAIPFVCIALAVVMALMMGNHKIDWSTKTMVAQEAKIIGADPNVPGWDYGDRSVDAVRAAVYTPDERDIDILQQRQNARLAIASPLEGDIIAFADGVTRRISSVTHSHVQTSDGGSWHLSASGYGSFSGSLYSPVPVNTLTDTGDIEPARFWFFHHAFASAHNAVYVNVNVRVWQSTEPAPV